MAKLTKEVINKCANNLMFNLTDEECETLLNEFETLFAQMEELNQLEGIDDWLLTEEYMPNLYSLTKESYNFKNHYSYYNGGGSTFNSEFAINTGFITPLSYMQNAYTFNKNYFPASMANIFKEKGIEIIKKQRKHIVGC